jgi:MFS family permease
VLATAGLVVAQPLAGVLVVRWGGRPTAALGAVFYAAGLPLAAAPSSVAVLALVLFAMGVANGLLDVAINVLGVSVERRSGIRMLASMHAAFSFGAMAGAGGGALAAVAAVAPLAHLAAVAVAVTLVSLAAAGTLPRVTADRRGPVLARPSRRLAGLGAAAFCVLLAEGSMTDWSAVYLNDVAGASEAVAAAGLTVFSLTMALGRLSGDRLAGRFGPVAMVAVGGALAAAGLGLALATAAPLAGLAGMAVMGAGLAATFPLIVGAAAAMPGEPDAPAVAAVSGSGYVGLMAGPATIGLLSDAAGLRSALVVVVVVCLAASALAVALRPAARATLR